MPKLRVVEARICGTCRDFGGEDQGFVPLGCVSDEDGFVRRMERIWRLGAAGFGTPENEGPAGARDVCC